MKLSFIKDISLLRFAGINNIIVLELYAGQYKLLLVKRKEGFFRLKKGDLHNFEVIHSEVCSSDFNPGNLTGKINSVLEKYGLKETAIAAGINDFRYSIASVPLDTEDVELWFLENSHKFMPEGRSKDEFVLSYELFKKDDNFVYYIAAVVRRDYLDKALSILKVSGLRILGVFPFRLLLPLNRFSEGKNVLYLEVLQNEVIYSFTSESGNFTSGEEYAQIIEEGRLNHSEFEGALSTIYEVVRMISAQGNLSGLEVLLSSGSEVYNEAGGLIKKMFNPGSLNNTLRKLEPSFISQGFALNFLFNDIDSRINFLDEELRQKEREPVEKLAAMRFILALGGVLIFILLSFYILEGYFSDKLQNAGDSLSGASTRLIEIEKLTKENAAIGLNLRILKGLKMERVNYTKLLSGLTQVTAGKSCLTGLNLKGKQGDYIDCELSGASRTQEEVARVIGRLEKLEGFREPVLLFSGQKDERYGGNTKADGLIRFNINVKYKAS